MLVVAHGAYEPFWDPEHLDRNSTVGCRILELKPAERLAFDWKGPVPYADLMNREPLPTRMAVSFESRGQNRTLIRLEHLGWGIGERWKQARAWQERVWREAMVELKRFLERPRRSVQRLEPWY